MEVFERPWFKWLSISTCLSLGFGIAGIFFFQEALETKEAREIRLQREVAARAYEDAFRSTMVRVYQNLRLGHFLAAYKNLDQIKPPDESLSSMHQEYFEAMSRVAIGLLENDFLDEAEKILRELQQLKEYEDLARDNLIKIASARRYESAQRFLAAGIKFLEEKKFVDAANEMRKAKLEFDSVALYQLQDVSKDLEKLTQYWSLAKFHVHREEAERAIAEATRLLKVKAFKETQHTMARAAGHVGRAAFFSSNQNTEVQKLRRLLLSLKADLAYEVPNAEPTYNIFRPDSMEKFPQFFHLKSANLSFNVNDPRDLKLELNYDMRPSSGGVYFVRYKAYFFNGKMYFNGHDIEGPEEFQFTDFLPKNLQGQPIKRVDISIYDQNNLLVSRAMKAFRPPVKLH